MADLNTVKSPGILVTLGLGSCVGIALYDEHVKIQVWPISCFPVTI